MIAKVAKSAQAEIKARSGRSCDNIEQAPGERAVAEATRRAGEFAARYRRLYPRAVACLEDDFASLTVHLCFPREHWNRIRHSNFILTWSSLEGVFDVRRGASGCRVLRRAV